MTDAVTVGIVGCGRLAEAGYLPALERAAGVRVVAVADPDPTRRDRVAGLAGGAASTHPGVRELLDRARPDALLLVTPVGTHLDDARAASDAGVPALLEKPPAPDADAACRIADLAQPPWIAFNRRFDTGAARARAALADHDDFDLVLAIGYRRRSWAPVQVHDDALLDLGPHLVDWARWLTGGEIDDVRALDLEPDRAVLEMRTRRGTAELTATTNTRYREHIEARTPSGAVLVRHRRGSLVDAVRGRLPGAEHPLIATLSAQLDEFARVVRGAAPQQLATAAEGHAVMQVLDAARASATAGGRPVATDR